MKKHYATLFIGTSMLIGGGHAFAQSSHYYPEIPKEIALQYVNELNQSRSAKLDTIYKYRENNLYGFMTEYLKEQNKQYIKATKPNHKAILKLSKKLKHAKTEFERESILAQLGAKQDENTQKYEYYNNIRSMYIDDAFVKCLIGAEYMRNRRK